MKAGSYCRTHGLGTPWPWPQPVITNPTASYNVTLSPRLDLELFALHAREVAGQGAGEEQVAAESSRLHPQEARKALVPAYTDADADPFHLVSASAVQRTAAA